MVFIVNFYKTDQRKNNRQKQVMMQMQMRTRVVDLDELKQMEEICI